MSHVRVSHHPSKQVPAQSDLEAIVHTLASWAHGKELDQWSSLSRDIAALDSSTATDSLVVAVKRTHNKLLRRQAAMILGAVTDRRIEDLLLSFLQDPDWVMRVDALRSLGRVGSEVTLRRAFSALRDPSPEVRIEAIRLVSSRSGRQLVEVAPLLDDDDEAVREEAARAIVEAMGRR